MLLLRNKRTDNKKAFSLTELMIACVIIAVLVIIAAPSYLTHRLRAEEQKAIATLYAFSQAQKAYWFEQDPNTYANILSELSPSYINVLDGDDEDGDWRYDVSGDDSTFTITADHLNMFGAVGDGLQLTINEQGNISRTGSWPYTVYETP